MTFRNLGSIGLSLARRETIQTNTPPKPYTKTGCQNISSSLNEKRKHTKWVSATKKVQVKQEMRDINQPKGKGDKTRRSMACEQQINRLLGLFAVKII